MEEPWVAAPLRVVVPIAFANPPPMSDNAARMHDESRSFARTVLAALVAVNVLSLFTTWAEVSRPWPKTLGFPLMVASVLSQALALAAGFAVLGLLALLLFAAFSSSTRRLLPTALATTAALLVVTLPTQLAALRIWDAGFERLAGDAAPVIGAIRKFEADHGAPPADLAALGVPIPPTPCGCSEWRYERKSHGNAWTLSVVPPFRGVGFNRFGYWSGGRYPERDENGRFRSAWGWAFYRE